MKSMQQRLTPTTKLNMKDDSNLTRIYCVNHSNKTAKYYLVKDNTINLCSKCTVQMMGKGHKVEEIPGIEEEYRRKQINQFINQVNNNIPHIDKMMNALITKRDDIQKYYEQQKEKVEKFHTQIYKDLEEEKLKKLQQLYTNFKNVQQQYDESIQNLQSSKSETMCMKKDIEFNLNSIIKQIQNEPFNEIMASYHKNLQIFINKTDLIAKTPIEVLKVTLNEPINLSHLISISLLKTCLIKKNLQDSNNKQESNDSVYESLEKKEYYTQPKISRMALSSVKTPKQDYSIKNVASFEITNEELYEDGHSQMIERDDVENSYQMMLLDTHLDQEPQKNDQDILGSFGPIQINNNSNPNNNNTILQSNNNKLLVSKIIERNNQKNIDKNYMLKATNTSLKHI
ncbi:unnamed protein product [Paramecium pentaurelia]|uniref:B box-type domain-containing protein n=1 Tax=Paramecium pentaurelia TaxID=43138 RepID=A0A8S1UZS6_9CILI|nr:unnamed protein product [Paramecium pentaurelia]